MSADAAHVTGAQEAKVPVTHKLVEIVAGKGKEQAPASERTAAAKRKQAEVRLCGRPTPALLSSPAELRPG